MIERPTTIRLAKPDDTTAVRRLAQLDSTPSLRGRVLLAEADGIPIAAISLKTGMVAADPFQYSAAAVHLLRTRRYQLLRQGREVAPAPQLLRRLVPDPGR